MGFVQLHESTEMVHTNHEQGQAFRSTCRMIGGRLVELKGPAGNGQEGVMAVQYAGTLLDRAWIQKHRSMATALMMRSRDFCTVLGLAAKSTSSPENSSRSSLCIWRSCADSHLLVSSRVLYSDLRDV